MSRPNLPTEISTRLKRFLRWLSEPEDWIDVTFSGNWANFDPAWASAQYHKDPFGVVHVRGLVKNLTGGTADSAIFVLPVGYRPLKSEMFAGIEDLSFVRITVNTSGTVFTNNAATTTATSVSMSFKTN